VVDKQINPYAVLLRPLITEKGTALSMANQYVFEVAMRSNKPQIKTAVETAFNVTVTAVNTMVMKGKPRGARRYGRRVTYGSDWKKAVVTLAPADKIELFEGV
jgi:large subunit ribosomal protein L23